MCLSVFICKMGILIVTCLMELLRELNEKMLEHSTSLGKQY